MAYEIDGLNCMDWMPRSCCQDVQMGAIVEQVSVMVVVVLRPLFCKCIQRGRGYDNWRKRAEKWEPPKAAAACTTHPTSPTCKAKADRGRFGSAT